MKNRVISEEITRFFLKIVDFCQELSQNSKVPK